MKTFLTAGALIFFAVQPVSAEPVTGEAAAAQSAFDAYDQGWRTYGRGQGC